jgi:hypothetical protein
LLVRAAHVEVTGIWATVFMALAAFSALSSSIIWLRAKDELQGRPYWILGIGAFALASAIKGLSIASAAWGLAMLYSGALLFLFSARLRWLLVFPILGMIGFSTLPFTPAWEGSAFFSLLPWPYRIVFLISLAVLLLGYLRHTRRLSAPESGFERWMWVVYPVGLALLPLTHFGLVYTKWGMGSREISMQTPGWWSGLISFGVAALFLVLSHREASLVPPFLSRIGETFSLNWVYRFFWWLYRTLGRGLSIFTQLLEGDGGILWALLILIMLLVTVNLWGVGDNFEF